MIIIIMIHLNLSTTANLGTEESGRSGEVGVMGRWGCNTTIYFRYKYCQKIFAYNYCSSINGTK